MNIVLLQTQISEEEIRILVSEFPLHLFIAPSEVEYKHLSNDIWGRVEILYGNKLSVEDLEKAHQLRWIHTHVPNINPLCLNEIEKRGNIIVTRTKEENTIQIGEYVMAATLAFAKNLFHWETLNRYPKNLWNSKWRESMWTLSGRRFLQIGLGNVGTEIARRASIEGMEVWGIQDRRSFHPFCRKVFTTEELHSALPDADVVCVAVPREQQKGRLIGMEELELMKEDSILIVMGYRSLIDEEALTEVAIQTQKFRGIVLDAFYQLPISPHSKIWSLPNILITPEVAPRPKSSEKESFRLFKHNFRQYLHGNFADMRNVVGTKKIFSV